MKKIKRIMQAALSVLLMTSVFYFGNSSGENAYAHTKENEIIITKGDTLYSLAKQHNTTVQKLKEHNHLTSNIIYVGQKLFIPDTGHPEKLYVVMAGSFTKKAYASNRVSLLKKKGIDAVIVKKVINNTPYYRVQAGAFSNRKNAEREQTVVKLAGITDAYILSMSSLHINGITLENNYNQLTQKFGKPLKSEEQLNIKSLFYMNEGAGVRVKLNMTDGEIDELQIYPEYLTITTVPNEKKQVLDIYGYPNKSEKVSCYESASCEQLIYQFNGEQLTVRMDHDGENVQFLKLNKFY